jgi:NitT/TauT family transport system permease protein
MAVGVVQGMHALDSDLLEMARAFKIGTTQRILHVFLPQLLPHFLSSARYGLALSWKVVVIIEMMGLTSGIGYMISFWFGVFSMERVLAWTLSFTVCMFLIESFVFKAVERQLLHWRPQLDSV